MTTESDFIQLYSGKDLNFLSPSVDDIDIEDIAHTLSLLCRFGGHCRTFYSVAQHSVLCSYYAPKGFEFEALLHDGAEAYLVDMPRPIKYALQGYRDLETVLDGVVREKFNLPIEMSPEVKWVDSAMLATERRDLMKGGGKSWAQLPDPFEEIIEPMSHDAAKIYFLTRYKELTSEM